MEYAYINYLLENNIYKEEANMLFYYYTIELLINSIHADIICRISSIEDNLDNQLNVNIEDFNNYIETIKRNYNLHDIPTNNKVSLRDPFIYGFGQLFSIYMYENYKKDPNYFKKELKVSLLEYSSSNDISSFERLGVTSDNLVNSDILKRVLTKNS